MKSLKILAMITVLFLLAVVVSACEFWYTRCEHEWLDATCTEPRTCNICAETEGDPLGHTEETIEGNPATCLEAGKTDGKKCSACGTVTVPQEEIPVTEHKDEDADYVCDVCEAELCTTHIPSDAVKENEVTPTCTKEGSYELVVRCSACNKEISRDTVAVNKLPHTEGEAARENEVDPTCENKGSYDLVVKCTVCSEELSRNTVEVDKLGHTEGEAARENEVAPTCSAEGSCDLVVKCTVCSKELSRKTEPVAKLPHTEETVAGKAATCTEAGLTDGKKCTVCGETTLAQEVISAPGHTDTDNNYKCDVCGTNICTAHTPAEAVRDNEKAPTCTAEGSYDSVVKCSKCGEEISRETVTVDKLPHAEETVAGKAATCTEAGLTDGKKCTVCGETTLAQKEISALGHKYNTTYEWSDDNSTCTAHKVCANDASHATHETVTVSTVTLNVTATKVTFTYNVSFANSEFAAQTKVVEADITLESSIATINAPTIKDRVASHDYVKFGFHDANATYTFTIYYSEVDVWDGTSVSTSLAGKGTADEPYLIQSAADFAYFAGQLNSAAVGQTENFSGKYFKMTKSIDLNGHLLIAGNHSGWNKYQGFGGTFDGNNCTIRGINVKPTTGTSSALFGCITKAGTLKNLIVYGEASGAATVGGVVAYQLGKVDNVTSYVTVTATGGTIGGVVANQESGAGALTNCVNYGNVTSTSYIVGGVVGSGGATITNCVNWGNVQGGSECLGGIAGTTKNNGTISGCYNYGSVKTTAADKGNIGGIAGKCLKPVSDCHNFGTIIGVNTTGGIVGSTDSTITNCTNHGDVNGTSWLIGGIAGSASANVTGCINYANITSTGDCVGGIVGSSTATVSDCTNYGTIKGTGRSAGIAYYSNGTIDNCVNNGEVIGGWDLGGILAWVGDGMSAIITNCTNNGNITGSWNNGGIFGLAHDNAGTVTITGCTNNGHIKSTTGGQISIAVKAVITDCTENGSWTVAE